MPERIKGWVINADLTEACHQIERPQHPVIFLSDGAPVFELWKWHRLLGRWFVLSWQRDPHMERQGVVYYTPDEVPQGLRARMLSMEQQAGVRR